MKIHHILSLAALLSMPAAAQELHTSYFLNSSVNRHEMNPAMLDKSYVSMPLVLGNLNVGTTGNVGLKSFVYEMDPSWQGYNLNGGNNLTTFMHPSVDANKFLGGLKDNNRISANLKYQIFGVGFKAFNGMNLIELNIRSNTSIALPKTLFEFAKTAGAKEDYNISDLGVRTENFAELALGHSHKINDKITIGGKMKFLFGLAYADVTANNVNLHLSEDVWRVDGDVRAKASLMDTEVELSNKTEPNKYVAPGQTPRHRVHGLDDFKAGLSGFGVAFDLGATYQVYEDLKVSAAVTDLGFISWKNMHQASSTGSWEFDGFDEDVYVASNRTETNEIGDQFEALGNDLGNIFAVYYDGKKSECRALAANINIGAEYVLPYYRKLTFGFLYNSRIAGHHSYHSGTFSANVAPAKWFDASLSLGFTSTGVVGGLVGSLHAKHFNVFVGTDRFFGKLSKQGIPLNRANSNISVGISFPLSAKL